MKIKLVKSQKKKKKKIGSNLPQTVEDLIVYIVVRQKQSSKPLTLSLLSESSSHFDSAEQLV